MLIALQIIGGLLLLFLGGEALVRGAVGISREFGIPKLVIGLTVVAYGTSSPELFISAQAALENHHAIAIGNVLGSNIANILVVLGVSALLFPIDAKDSQAKRENLTLIAVVLLFFAFAWTGNMISFWEGMALTTILIAYTWMLFREARKNRLAREIEQNVDEQAGLSLWASLTYIIAGFAMLILGSDIMISGASGLAHTAGVSEAAIGTTLVALGGSSPEFITSVVAAYRRHTELALGNVLGSNLFNLLGVIGITTIMHPVVVDSRFLAFDLPVVLATSVLLLLIKLRFHQIGRLTGAIFIGGYGIYALLQF